MIFQKKSEKTEAALQADEIVIQKESWHKVLDKQLESMIRESKWIWAAQVSASMGLLCLILESKPEEWSKELIVALFVRGVWVFGVERQNAFNRGDNTVSVSLFLSTGLPDTLDVIDPRPFCINLDRTLVP